MKNKALAIVATALALCVKADFHEWAPTPPMGWNSWDCYGAAVNEEQVKANADVLAARLLKYGYEYCIVDIRWTVQNEGFTGYNQKDPVYTLDEWGRYLPAPNRFPSSAGGKGFKPLADYCHAKGLKFGIHIMRGVPKEAVAKKLPVQGAKGVACDQIGNNKVECAWLRDNCTVEAGKSGAQEYYDSIFRLYASWGVDFVKVDDLSAPCYHRDEIEMIRKAIDKCGRRIVFSTSPGETPLDAADHLRAHANMWRMVNDVWDSWRHIEHLMPIACDWLEQPATAGCWPDCDMIPLGKLGVAGHYWSKDGASGRDCALTKDEQRTLMTFFAICRSPLFIGADLPQLDTETFALLTDPLILAAQRDGRAPKPLFCDKEKCAILSNNSAGGKFLALFNLKNEPAEVSALGVTRALAPHACALVELKDSLVALGYQTPGKRGGLSFLVGKPDGTWEHAFRKNFQYTYSNLGDWGQKKLFEPYVICDKKGSYHVFFPFVGRPALGHAESWTKGNLRNWGRENWIELGPKESGLPRGVRVGAPIVELDDNGHFLVRFVDAKTGRFYKVSTDGKVALGASAPISKEEYEEVRSRLVKTVEFDGGTYSGSVVAITPEMREMLRSEFGEWKEFPPWFMGADNVKDDVARYGEAAKDAKLTMKFDGKKDYAISTNLIGVFFEDINSSHEIFTVKNGWREDMVKALKDLKPKFMRFPGGCIVHGRDFKSMYHWKETVGPHGTRKGKPNLFWGGHQDFELGYYEYFVLCEKIGAEPVPILPAGSSCPNPQVWVTDDELKILVQDALDLVEFANGDPSKSKWAKLRADMGHPKPFNLKYVGIGNEDDINDYFERGFTAIYSAMRKKYPEITIVGSAGPAAGGRDYEEGWKLGKKLKVDILDEHYYVGPGWYYANQKFYDTYDRKGPKVYVGEYAAHKDGRVNDMETACATAIHLCNIERNGDIVEMTSYAPLFAKRSDTRWAPDLIYFTDEAIELTTDYWVQWMFGNYGGSRYVPHALALETPNSRLNKDDQSRFRNRFAASVVKDGKKTILKVVNSTQLPMQFEADLAPLGVKDGTKAEVTVLAGKFDDKTAKPETRREKINAKLVRTLPSNSVTVIVF